MALNVRAGRGTSYESIESELATAAQAHEKAQQELEKWRQQMGNCVNAAYAQLEYKYSGGLPDDVLHEIRSSMRDKAWEYKNSNHIEERNATTVKAITDNLVQTFDKEYQKQVSNHCVNVLANEVVAKGKMGVLASYLESKGVDHKVAAGELYKNKTLTPQERAQYQVNFLITKVGLEKAHMVLMELTNDAPKEKALAKEENKAENKEVKTETAKAAPSASNNKKDNTLAAPKENEAPSKTQGEKSQRDADMSQKPVKSPYDELPKGSLQSELHTHFPLLTVSELNAAVTERNDKEAQYKATMSADVASAKATEEMFAKLENNSKSFLNSPAALAALSTNAGIAALGDFAKGYGGILPLPEKGQMDNLAYSGVLMNGIVSSGITVGQLQSKVSDIINMDNVKQEVAMLERIPKSLQNEEGLRKVEDYAKATGTNIDFYETFFKGTLIEKLLQLFMEIERQGKGTAEEALYAMTAPEVGKGEIQLQDRSDVAQQMFETELNNRQQSQGIGARI